MICEHMYKSARKTIPVNTFNKHTKPYSTGQIKELHRNMRQSRLNWLEEGRPRDKIMNHTVCTTIETDIQSGATQSV